jgi:hypothetical protein
LQKYNEAASKIQTRYRAYKSLSSHAAAAATSKAYQYHRANSYNNRSLSGGISSASKLLSQFHHSSIDETTSTCSNYSANSSYNLNENSNSMTGSSSDAAAELKHMMISSDMQINGNQQYQSATSSASSLCNQRQASRKMVSAARQGGAHRFSPATPSPMSPPGLSSSNNNNSSVILNNQQQQQQQQISFGFDHQNQSGQQMQHNHQLYQEPYSTSNYDFNKGHAEIHQPIIMNQQLVSMDSNHA